jgi:hypothetical protein
MKKIISLIPAVLMIFAAGYKGWYPGEDQPGKSPK